MLKKIFLAAVCVCALSITTACKSEKDNTPVSSDVEQEDTEKKEEPVKTTDVPEMTPYQEQSIVSAINNRLSQMYEIGTYGWVTLDSISLRTDAQGNLIASVDINRTEGSNRYTVPAEFTLVFDHSSNTYTIQDAEVDNEEKQEIVKDNTTPSSQPPTDLIEQDSFDINVQSSFTITLDTSGGGHGAAYAKSDDGKYTLICDAQSEEKTGTVDLPSGHYTVILYAEQGTHWSWQYQVN
ncbi:MAG: hypothetical protein ACI32N_05215 [Bulleidia sp.]